MTEGVAHGGTGAKHVIGVEPEIVLDVVVVNLGADEDASPNAVANASAEMLQEVSTAGVVNASRAVAGGDEVEAIAGNAEAAHKVEADFFAQLRLEEQVGVGEDGPVSLVAEVVSLPIPPGTFDIDAEAMPRTDDIQAEADVGAVFFLRRLEGREIPLAGGGQKGGAADHDVHLLLSRSEAGKQKNRTHGCEQREFSQYSPHVNSFGILEFTHQTGGTPAKQPRGLRPAES